MPKKTKQLPLDVSAAGKHIKKHREIWYNQKKAVPLHAKIKCYMALENKGNFM